MDNNFYYDFHFFEYDFKKKTFPNRNFPGLKKYQQLLPIKVFDELSLGEGQTALTKAYSLGHLLGFSNLYIKHEEQNPTGNFKDRESFIAVNFAKEKDLKEIVIASSGNAALSMAAYAKRADIVCQCFIPASTSQAKKELITFFGGQIREIEGNYEQVYRYVADHFEKNSNVTSGINSERVEGDKTISYEIWEEIGVPDVVVVPCGNGGNLAGIWRGFYELKELGLGDKIPIMLGVQVIGASPLLKAINEGTELSIYSNGVDSIAEGIVAEESYCSPKAVKALQSSNGFIIEVTDQEIVEALKTVISHESLIIEPTSAAVFAALPKLHEFGISKHSRVVAISTGSGMKMLEEIKSLMGKKF